MLWTTNKLIRDKAQNIQIGNQNAPSTVGRTDKGGVDRNIKNLSTIINLTKSIKSKLTKPKKSDLSNIKANSKPDFLPLEPKRPSYTYKKLLPKLQFLGILI